MAKLIRRKMVWIAGAVLLIAIIVVLVLVYPILSMQPIATGEIQNTGILAVKNGNGNMFVLQSGEGYILIDAGTNANGVKKTLEQKEIPLSEIRHVFLTHTDADHVDSVELFPNAEIYISQDELQMVNGEIESGKNNNNSKLKNIGLENIYLLIDNQSITIGARRIKCISAPGHTTGAMAYMVDDRYLFTGDCFKVDHGKLEVHPYSRDRRQSEESLNKLFEAIKNSEFVFTSHYGYHACADLILE